MQILIGGEVGDVVACPGADHLEQQLGNRFQTLLPHRPAGVDLVTDQQAQLFLHKGRWQRVGVGLLVGVAAQHRLVVGGRRKGGREQGGTPTQLQPLIHHLCRVQTEQFDGQLGAGGGCKKAEAFVEQVCDAQEKAQIEVQLHQLGR